MVLKIKRKWTDKEGKECEAWEFKDGISKCTKTVIDGIHPMGNGYGTISYECNGEHIKSQWIPHEAYLLNDNGQTIERLN